MARQEGMHKMTGYLDGKIYYTMNGRYYVRQSSAPTREKIRSDAAFEEVRHNNAEFGASAKMASVFRKLLGTGLQMKTEHGLMGRLTALFKTMVQLGQGERGQRSLEVRAHATLLQGFQWKPTMPLDKVLNVGLHLETDANRKGLRLLLPAFEVKTGLAKGTGASHFRMILTACTLSDYVWDAAQKAYAPREVATHQLVEVAYSPFVRMEGTSPELELCVKVPIEGALPEQVALVACVGIEFYQLLDDRMYLMEKYCSMKVVEVF